MKSNESAKKNSRLVLALVALAGVVAVLAATIERQLWWVAIGLLVISAAIFAAPTLTPLLLAAGEESGLSKRMTVVWWIMLICWIATTIVAFLSQNRLVWAAALTLLAGLFVLADFPATWERVREHFYR